MSAVLELRGIRKSFDGVTAVDDVSVAVQPNEFLALLGASGCGKTTLLRVMAGLEAPDAGQVLIADSDMTHTPAHLRPVNLMFQSYALFPHLTVAGNVAFGLTQEGLRGVEREQRVTEALRMVEMDGLAARKPDQLSGGQKQRVALARCIAKRPKVLLLDEPMAALDRALRERTRLELRALRARLGISFVIVTHDQEDAMTMADRVAVMDRGRIVQLASPRELYDAPASKFVAGFFGESNIWDGVVAAGNIIDIASLGLSVRAPQTLDVAGTPIAVAVRPERIRLGADGGPHLLRGVRVESVVYLGTVTTYLLRSTSGALLRVTSQNGIGPAYGQGDIVDLSWPADALIVLRT